MRTLLSVLVLGLLLSLATVPAQAQIEPQATCPGGLPAGQVFDCSISQANEVDTYTFTAQQNDAWYFRVQRTAGTLQPLIDVVDQSNNQVCANYTFTDFVAVNCPITTSGAYTFSVRDRAANSGRTGTYIVYGQRVNSPAQSTPIAFGSQTSAALQYGIENDVFRFNALINDKLVVRVWRSVGAMQPTLYVYDSAGNQLCGSYTFNQQVNLDCTVNKTDTYYVFIGDRLNTNTGSYTLHLQRLNNPGNATTLDYGAPLTRAIAVAAEMDAYVFTALANDQAFLRVKANSGNLQPSLYVYDNAGKSVCGSYTFNTFVGFDCAITAGGRYTVIMQDRQLTGTGNYTLYLQRTRNPGNAVPLAFGQTRNGAIDALGSFDTYTFQPKKNIKVNVSLARTAGSMDFWAGVYNASGERICYSYSFNGALDLTNCAITAIGQHTLIVFDRNDDATGTYRITLSCDISACAASVPLKPSVYIPFVRRSF